MSNLYQLAEAIESQGTKKIFGIPGSGPSLTLLDLLEKRNVEFILTHFEGSAVIMAGTFGGLSGQAGLSISIKGPGLANMISGLAACYFESLPVIAISEAYTPFTPLSKAHKRLDHKLLTSAIVKTSCLFNKNGFTFSKLADIAKEEVPGPVHLDISNSDVESDTYASIQAPQSNYGFNTKRFFDIVSSSRKPIIIAGTLAVRKNWSGLLNRLLIPIFSTAAAKGVVDESLPQSAGVYTGAGLELSPEFTIADHADLVIGLGLRHREVINVKPFKCPVICIDPLGKAVSTGFNNECTIEGTTEQAEELFTKLNEKSWGLDIIRKFQAKLRTHLLSSSFLPANIYKFIEEHFSRRVRIVMDTGNFCTIGEHILKVAKADLYLSSGQGRFMGIGLPMAVAAALYDSKTPTVVFTGDGSIGMFVSDVKIAIENHLPLIIVLMTDGYFGSIRMRSVKDGITQKPLIIKQPSWLKVFEGFGFESVLVENETKLREAVSQWDISKRPLFIQIPCDPNDYLEMVNGLREG